VTFKTYVISGGDPTFPRGWKVKATAKIADLAKEYQLDETAVKKIKVLSSSEFLLSNLIECAMITSFCSSFCR